MEIDSVSYLKFFFALVFVLGLIAGLAVIAKKIGMGNRGPMRRAKSNRLSIIESMAVDAKRRVILIRRDDKEHMLLLGGVNELVIEGDIALDPEREKAAQDALPEAGLGVGPLKIIDQFRSSKPSSKPSSNPSATQGAQE